jgi:hypothetical protein
MDELISRVARLAAEGIYEPGQYAPHGGLAADELVTNADGSVSFDVSTTVPDTDRETVRVTVSRT